uniref:Uncharacterized protein n=1 Tax=Setaria italica TaxID=4555 RepID=K4APB5_SETIT
MIRYCALLEGTLARPQNPNHRLYMRQFHLDPN